uniref:Uncharacterized protein n=1 Tax=Rhizophora mucronata TaxID=61149 RepID=A0A2P2IST7_RHIMU
MTDDGGQIQIAHVIITLPLMTYWWM